MGFIKTFSIMQHYSCYYEYLDVLYNISLHNFYLITKCRLTFQKYLFYTIYTVCFRGVCSTKRTVGYSKRQSYVSLLDSSCIVRSVSRHYHFRATLLQESYYLSFLLWLSPSKNSSFENYFFQKSKLVIFLTLC